MSLPKFPPPSRLQAHHVPNVLPAHHGREDYDFDYKDGVWGPIRIAAVNVPEIFVDIPALVWCRRHGWEKEIFPQEEVFREGEVWGWQCSGCKKSRITYRLRHMAEGALRAHKRDRNHEDKSPAYRFRISRDEHDSMTAAGRIKGKEPKIIGYSTEQALRDVISVGVAVDDKEYVLEIGPDTPVEMSTDGLCLRVSLLVEKWVVRA